MRRRCLQWVEILIFDLLWLLVSNVSGQRSFEVNNLFVILVIVILGIEDIVNFFVLAAENNPEWELVEPE